jgi:hypothetical protein
MDVPLDVTGSGDVRIALAHALADRPEYASVTHLEFARPVSARHWLETSNPSERWKWEVFFRDLPPVKGASPVPAVGPNTLPLESVD